MPEISSINIKLLSYWAKETDQLFSDLYNQCDYKTLQEIKAMMMKDGISKQKIVELINGK